MLCHNRSANYSLLLLIILKLYQRYQLLNNSAAILTWFLIHLAEIHGKWIKKLAGNFFLVEVDIKQLLLYFKCQLSTYNVWRITGIYTNLAPACSGMAEFMKTCPSFDFIWLKKLSSCIKIREIITHRNCKL